MIKVTRYVNSSPEVADSGMPASTSTDLQKAFDNLEVVGHMLPHDLVLCIIDQTDDKKTLRSWALVSKRCYTPAIIKLYRHIVVPTNHTLFIDGSPSILNDILAKKTCDGDDEVQRASHEKIERNVIKMSQICRSNFSLLYMLANSTQYAPEVRKNKLVRHLEFDAYQAYPKKCNQKFCPCGNSDVLHRVRLLKKVLSRLPEIRSLRFEAALTPTLYDRITSSMPKLYEIEVNTVAHWFGNNYRGGVEDNHMRLPRKIKKLTFAGLGSATETLGIMMANNPKNRMRIEELAVWGHAYDWADSFIRAVGTNGFIPSLKKLNVTGLLTPLSNDDATLRPHHLAHMFRHTNLTHLTLRQYVRANGNMWGHQQPEPDQHLHEDEQKFLDLLYLPSLRHFSYGFVKHINFRYNGWHGGNEAYSHRSVRLPILLNAFLETHGEKLQSLHLHNLLLSEHDTITFREATARFHDAVANCKLLSETTWGCHIQEIIGPGDGTYYAQRTVLANTFNKDLHKYFFRAPSDNIEKECEVKLEHFTYPTAEMSLLHTIRSHPQLTRLKVTTPWALSPKAGPDNKFLDMGIRAEEFAKIFEGSQLRLLMLWENAAGDVRLRHRESGTPLTYDEYLKGQRSSTVVSDTHVITNYRHVHAIAIAAPKMVVITQSDLRFFVQRDKQHGSVKLWRLDEALDKGIMVEGMLNAAEWRFLGRYKKMIEAKQDECCSGMFGEVWGESVKNINRGTYY